jgi:hypothetical protein
MTRTSACLAAGLLLAAFTLLAAPAVAQDDADLSDAAKALLALMPGPDDLPGFETGLAPEVYARDELSDLINGEVEAFYPHGVGDTVSAMLKRGTTRVQVTIFDMTTPLGAYGVFSTHRPPTPDRVGIGTDSFADNVSLVFYKGRYYTDLTVMGRRDDGPEVLHLIGEAIAGRIEAEDAVPPELALFPEDGRAPDSDQYVPRGYLGLEEIPDAFVMGYNRDGAELRASLSPFADEDAAKAAYDALSAYIIEKGEGGASGTVDGRAVVTGTLKYRGRIAATTEGRHMLTACGGDAPEPVMALLLQLAERVGGR